MEQVFNPQRLEVARQRRQLSKKAFAESSGIADRTLRKYEKEGFENLTIDELSKFAKALDYPLAFFYGDDLEPIDFESVSFRSLSSTKASQKLSAIAAGTLAYEFNKWMENKFNLPKVNVPQLGLQNSQDAEKSAIVVRSIWAIGNKSISNVVHLLEKNGVRVFSLSENNLNVNAYSFWKDGVPFVFLNNKKSAECQRFDACHELGHLVMHHDGTPRGREAEMEANRFASALLMPEDSISQYSFRHTNLSNLIQFKHNWKVSLAALVRRLFDLNKISDWHYHDFSRQMGMRGYFKAEPDPMPEREKSKILEVILSSLREERKTLNHLSKELRLPVDELHQLLFGPSTPDSKLLRQSNKLPSLAVV
ncbi:XRE family transcriptional regulator [uncultured Gilvimarinus sp.]|uniref:helix-turn-helix domain-containing protein n=1 Tax=uncultured Gilvimarinus sp. TaxID=1689143 RepID=UPI0030D8D80D